MQQRAVNFWKENAVPGFVRLHLQHQNLLFTPINYAQIYLIRKLNHFLDQKKLERISEKGICHGLGFLWYEKKEWFYRMRKLILTHTTDQLLTLYDKDVSEFIQQVLTRQYPKQFSYKIAQQYIDISYLKFGDVLKSDFDAIIQSLNEGELCCAIAKNKELAFNHSLFIEKVPTGFLFFDANDTFEKAQQFSSPAMIFDEVSIRCFEKPQSQLPLDIIVASKTTKPEPILTEGIPHDRSNRHSATH